jgi:hypothetical protein
VSRLFIIKNRCVLQPFRLESIIFSLGFIYGPTLAFADYAHYCGYQFPRGVGC